MPRSVWTCLAIFGAAALSGMIGRAGDGPETPAPATAASTARVWDIWEIGIPPSPSPEPYRTYLDNPSRRPRLVLQVTRPDGTTVEVPMFRGRAHRRAFAAANSVDAREPGGAGIKRPRPEFVPEGPPLWRGRFTPESAGRHTYAILRRERIGDGNDLENNAAIMARGGFTALPSAAGRRGFARRHPNLPDRFMTSDGNAWFALGHNVCWVAADEGVDQYEAYFDRMAAAGENYTRIWLCTWGVHPDGRAPGEVDEENAERLDAILRAARERGIYVKLCLDNFFDFRHNWDKSPFNSANGGPCRSRLDFWTKPEALAQYRARLHYLVARYSAYDNLMAWELWNEMNYALTAADFPDTPVNPDDPEPDYAGDADESTIDRRRREVQVAWTRDMAAELRRLDPHRHLVTTSLGMHVNWPELWSAPEIDFVQFHSYIQRFAERRTDIERDAVRLVLASRQAVRPYGKPALLAEFGYAGEDSSSAMNLDDPDGIMLHNALWSGALSGLAGTPMFWWWDNYIHPRGLYRRHAALARFLAPVDWNLRYTPFRDESAALRLLGLRAPGAALLWLQNRESTWDRRITLREAPRQLVDVELAFPVADAAAWQAEWFDTQNGAVIRTDTLAPEMTANPEADGHYLRLRPPPFRYDLAGRLTRQGE